MSACWAGCGLGASHWGSYLCESCSPRWDASPEAARCDAMEVNIRNIGIDAHERRCEVAFMDFCTRIRAERINGRGNEAE